MKQKLETKKITALLHFTRLSNLESILENGLLRRNEIEKRDLEYTFNDKLRLDGHLDSISCSISFPNYRMFYKLRCDNPDEDWVVLALSTNVLIDKQCSYYPKNAATGDLCDVDPATLRDLPAFDAMFADTEGVRRSDLDIPDKWTTDPQAEVLVFDDVEPIYIRAIATKNLSVKNKVLEISEGLDVRRVARIFGPRTDYEHWRE